MNDVMDINPEYISQTTKFLRKIFGLTQENLADQAGLTTRTIEKIESGRHKPELQTLRSIARATGMKVDVFRKPSAAEEAAANAEMERARHKTILAPVSPIGSATDFLAVYGGWHARRVDISHVQSDEALRIAAELDDWLEDLSMCWDEISSSDRLESANSIVSLCKQLEAAGYSYCIGTHKQVQRTQGKRDLVFLVGVVVVLPKVTAAEDRFAVIELEGSWERCEPIQL